VCRRVALKLIRTGMDSKGVLQRFEQERQVLAMMEQPQYRPGARREPDAWRPAVFCDELVNGQPLTRLCDDPSC